MHTRNRILILGYRVVFLVLCSIGIMGHMSVDDPVQNINTLAFFTIHSNLFCLGIVLFEAYNDFVYLKHGRKHRYGSMYYQLKGVALLVISITCLTYNYILTPLGFHMVEEYHIEADLGSTLHDRIVHFIVPAMMWVEYLLFQPKGHYGRLDPLKWYVAPLIYFVFIMIRARQISPAVFSRGVVKYPYFFLDVETYGVGYVIGYVVMFSVVTLVIGYVIRAIDFLGKMIYTKVINYADSSINEEINTRHR